jgi:cysteine-rich repeat protein
LAAKKASAACSQSNLVLNGDFEGGNAGFTSMLQSDPTGVQKAVCGGSRRAPGADKYRVSNVPALVCGCLGGSGSCIETWSSLDKTLWSQSVPVIAGRSYKATFAFMADQKFPGGCAPTSSDCQPGLNLMAAGLKIKGVIGGPPTTNSYLGSPVSSWRLSGGSAFRPNKSGSIDLAFLVRGNGGYVILDSISLVGPSECSSPPVCGNGRIDPGEKCDDQNRREGDGCNASCQVESGWSCTGAPTRCVRTQAPTSSEVQ